MKIESIRVQGYRSLKDVTIHPADLRVLVGPNNAGKSNIVDAIGFLSDVYRSGISVALKNRDGFDRIVYRRNGEFGHQMSFAIELFMGWDEFNAWAHESEDDAPGATNGLVPVGIRLSHAFAITGLGEPVVSNFVIANETLRIELVHTGAPLPLLGYVRNENHVSPDIAMDSAYLERLFRFTSENNLTMVENFMTWGTESRKLTLEQIEGAIPLIQRTISAFSDARTYQIYPNVSRSVTPPESESRLSKSGSNLPAAVQNLQQRHPSAWSKVEEAMYSVAPQITDISVETTYDRQWILRFAEANGNTWLASEVSDGTIRTLALLVAIFDPATTLLMIEEPENSIHPWMVRTILEACRASIKQNPDRQILLTTHSPVVIDALELKEILMVWRENEATRLKSLADMDPDIRVLWENGEMGLFDILDSGFVDQDVPIFAT